VLCCAVPCCAVEALLSRYTGNAQTAHALHRSSSNQQLRTIVHEHRAQQRSRGVGEAGAQEVRRHERVPRRPAVRRHVRHGHQQRHVSGALQYCKGCRVGFRKSYSLKHCEMMVLSAHSIMHAFAQRVTLSRSQCRAGMNSPDVHDSIGSMVWDCCSCLDADNTAPVLGGTHRHDCQVHPVKTAWKGSSFSWCCL
jgi:hypothetical protein